MSNIDKFNSFFKLHSKNVDNSNTQGFWKLSDEIIKTFLLDIISKRDGITLVDFGGGTGRWAQILDEYLKNSHIIIVDLSSDMLDVARSKVAKGVFKNKITLINSDMAQVESLKTNSADYIISTYNPLSFSTKPQKAINEAYRIVKKGGSVALTTQGYHNALFSQIYNFQAPSKALQDLCQRKKLAWNDFVPETWQLSKEDMEKMFKKAGFRDIESRGIACVIQPQDEDWDQSNTKIGKLSRKLNTDEEFFNTVLQIELSVGREQDCVNRGMNIMTIGQK